MTRASELLSQIYEESALDNPAVVASDNDADLDIDTISAMGDVLQDIVDNLSDDDLDEISPTIEGVLDEVDPDGELSVCDAVCLLPLADAQDLYDAVTAWCNTRGIEYDDFELDDDEEIDGEMVGPQGTGSIG